MRTTKKAKREEKNLKQRQAYYRTKWKRRGVNPEFMCQYVKHCAELHTNKEFDAIIRICRDNSIEIVLRKAYRPEFTNQPPQREELK